MWQAQRPTSPTEDTTNKEMTEAEREKISSYEDAFEKIKEETGVNSMNVRKLNESNKKKKKYGFFC